MGFSIWLRIDLQILLLLCPPQIRSTNHCHKNLLISFLNFWLCVLLRLVDRTLCLLLFSASFPLLPPHSVQRSQLCSLQSCDLLWHESLPARSYLTSGLWWAKTHPLFPIAYKGSLTGTDGHCDEAAIVLAVLAFDYRVSMQRGEEWSAPCSLSRSEYQVLESDLYLFPVSDVTVTKFDRKKNR